MKLLSGFYWPGKDTAQRQSFQSKELDVSQPYAFVNDQTRHYIHLRDHHLALSMSARSKLDQLNPFLRNGMVMPGEIVVVSDGSTHLCTPEETQLMELASQVRGAMIGMTNHESYVMTHNFDLLQSVMSYGSIGIGATTAAWSKHLKALEDLLKQTEALHQKWRAGGVTNDQFFAQRRALFSRMQESLKGIGRFGSGLNSQGKMKQILGISTKSYLHTGDIRGYASKVRGVTKMASAMSKGAYVGVALDVGVGALEIKEACSTGREEECTRAKYVETGKAAGGIFGAWAGGAVATAAGPAICVGLGVVTGGAALAGCVLVAGAGMAWGGGTVGSVIAEDLTFLLYEAVNGR
ncbi:hypothetical protein [Pseudomonas sp. SLFW]|uniref:hypothetical protein n=1 Tax=Pseudomonas sp. SLFW TaxID=2683259 RepID=UPI001413346D|nr:hypothetical protein [Pseudomonas sp. SLFW]NBB08038.1 hypothetical protein [Pseudomonas sp. SLFW]